MAAYYGASVQMAAKARTLLVLVLLDRVSAQGINTCQVTNPTVSPCQFTCVDGSIYDLTSIRDRTPGHYMHVADDGQGHEYFVGVCSQLQGFTCDSQTASAMQTWGSPQPPHFYGNCATLGEYSNMHCSSIAPLPSQPYSSGGMSCDFSGGEGGRSYTVKYNCALQDVQPTASQPGAYAYLISMSSPALCNQVGPGGGKQGLSGGSLFLILGSLAGAAYLVGGVYVNNKYHGLSGREALPHREKWGQLPGLVKDGCDFSYAHAKFAYKAFMDWYSTGHVEPALKEEMLGATDDAAETKVDDDKA